jgi:hypothetical protein
MIGGVEAMVGIGAEVLEGLKSLVDGNPIQAEVPQIAVVIQPEQNPNPMLIAKGLGREMPINNDLIIEVGKVMETNLM